MRALKKIAAVGCISLILTAGAAVSASADAPVITTPKASVNQSGKVTVKWGSSKNSKVDAYVVQRRTLGGEWKDRKTVSSNTNKYVDNLKNTHTKCFEYRIICKKGTEDSSENPRTGTAKGWCKVKICIDPGHLGTQNNFAGTKFKYAYSESVTMYKLGLSLQKKLEDYGISTVNTRKNVNSLGNGATGNSNDDLTYRGNCAGGCDYFIGLHTNVNSAFQKMSYEDLEKNSALIVFANNTAHDNKNHRALAKKVGTYSAEAMKDAGVSPFENKWFKIRTDNYSDARFNKFNDSLSTKSCFCLRQNQSNRDCMYGILRVSDYNKVPGIMLEQSYHTNPLVIKFFGSQDNIDKLAQAQADAFAEFYGFK